MLDDVSDVHELDRSSGVRAKDAPRPPCVLLATTVDAYPAEADELGTELVGRLGAALTVFHVPLVSGSPGSSEDFVREVAQRARELDALFVILPAREQHGHRVLALVRALQRPVLVTRRRLGSGAFLAATDLDDPDFPVVHQAAVFGHLLDARVIAMHNVAPGGGESKSHFQQLIDVTHRFRVGSAIITRHPDAADAILDEAHARAAATIVIGIRVGGRPVRRASITVDVVNLAHESVFIVPLLADPEPARLPAPRAEAG